MVALNAPVEIEPDIFPPVSNPLPTQETALVEDHVRVAEDPEFKLAGVADNETVGAGIELTVTV